VPWSVLDRLRAHVEVDVHDSPDGLDATAFRRRAQGKQGLVTVLRDRVDAEFLAAVPGLRVVGNIAVGYDNIDVAAAQARGVVVTNTPDVLTDATADLTIAMILDLTRRISEGDRLIRRGGWTGWALDFMLGIELRGRLLGIVGYGRIGRAVARRARAFGMRVAYTDRAGTGPGAPDDDARRMALEELLASADLVSIHVPLTAETRGLIGERELALMRRSACLVNTARGPVVDEPALVRALRAGTIAGAALDVFGNEPSVPGALLDLENVVLVPHLGSATVETRTAMADLAASNVLAVLTGQPPLTPVTR
jgi:glyoxylate reductase